MNLTQQFAASCGYVGSSPAMLKAFEEIRQSGIRAGRKAHDDRRKQLGNLIASPLLREGYFNLFRPVPFFTMHETVEFYRAEIARLMAAPEYRRDTGKLLMAKERLVFARYFRLAMRRAADKRRAA